MLVLFGNLDHDPSYEWYVSWELMNQMYNNMKAHNDSLQYMDSQIFL